MSSQIHANIPSHCSLAEIDYDTERNCFEAGCDSICRCSRIVNATIRTMNVTYSNFEFKKKNPKTDRMIKHKISDIEAYCIGRLILAHGGRNVDSYEINTTQGYYDEEAYVTFNNKIQLTEDVEKLVNMKKDIDKVFFVLEKEYSFIADIIKTCTNVDIINIKPSSIQPSTGSMMLKRQESYVFDIYEGDIVGIVKDGHLLVDGNHRYSYIRTHNLQDKNFKYISLS